MGSVRTGGLLLLLLLLLPLLALLLPLLPLLLVWLSLVALSSCIWNTTRLGVGPSVPADTLEGTLASAGVEGMEMAETTGMPVEPRCWVAGLGASAGLAAGRW